MGRVARASGPGEGVPQTFMFSFCAPYLLADTRLGQHINLSCLSYTLLP